MTEGDSGPVCVSVCVLRRVGGERQGCRVKAAEKLTVNQRSEPACCPRRADKGADDYGGTPGQNRRDS